MAVRSIYPGENAADNGVGGWVIGSLKSDESWCRQACQQLGMIILNVDYRLAPEFPFPAQIWDAWAALKWVFANASKLGIDPSRVSIGGLSAGGHLSAVLALFARDEPGMPPLKLQMLVVPAVDCRWTPIEGSCDPEVPYETYITCENAPCLPLHRMRWFSNLWLGTDPGMCYGHAVRGLFAHMICRRSKKKDKYVDCFSNLG